jgi:hypothetical protein
MVPDKDDDLIAATLICRFFLAVSTKFPGTLGMARMASLTRSSL